MSYLLLALYLLGLPLLYSWANRRFTGLRPVPPVLLCYGTGILVAASHSLPLPEDGLHRAAELSVLLALPLLLYATDLVRFVRTAPQLIGSFLLCVLSVCTAVIGAALWRGDTIESAPTVSGMLVGLYTGGTPDLNAVGVAAGAPESLLIYLNIADIVCGGVYFLLLISVVPTFFGYILPINTSKKILEEEIDARQIGSLDLLQAHGLAVLLLGISLACTYVATGGLSAVGLLILWLTSFSLLASLVPRVRQWRGTYEAGEYWLLVFSLAIGTLADFTQLAAGAVQLIGYMALVLTGSILLHLFLSALLRLDRDTVILTSVAALYGPAFIGQVAGVLGNRALVPGAIAASLVGYALGNYLGLAMIPLVRALAG